MDHQAVHSQYQQQYQQQYSSTNSQQYQQQYSSTNSQQYQQQLNWQAPGYHSHQPPSTGLYLGQQEAMQPTHWSRPPPVAHMAPAAVPPWPLHPQQHHQLLLPQFGADGAAMQAAALQTPTAGAAAAAAGIWHLRGPLPAHSQQQPQQQQLAAWGPVPSYPSMQHPHYDSGVQQQQQQQQQLLQQQHQLQQQLHQQQMAACGPEPSYPSMQHPHYASGMQQQQHQQQQGWWRPQQHPVQHSETRPSLQHHVPPNTQYAAQPPAALQQATAQQPVAPSCPGGQQQQAKHKQCKVLVVPRPSPISKKQRRAQQQQDNSIGRSKQHKSKKRGRAEQQHEPARRRKHMQPVQPPQQIPQQQGEAEEQQQLDEQQQQQKRPKQEQQQQQQPVNSAHGSQQPVFELLQLPQAVLARVAICLTKQERLALGTLVLPKVAPAAAAAVLGTIGDVTFCTKVTGGLPKTHPCVSGKTHVHYSKTVQLMYDAPGFVTALQDLRTLTLELGDARDCTPPAVAKKHDDDKHSQLQPLSLGPLRFDHFARLTALSALTTLQFTVQSPVVGCLRNGRPDMKQLQIKQQQQKAAVDILGRMTSLREVSISDGATEMQPCSGLFVGLSGLTMLQSFKLRVLSPRADLGLSQLSTLSSLTELSVQERPSESQQGLRGLGPLVASLQLHKLSISNWGPVPDLLLQPTGHLKALNISASSGLFSPLATRIAACTALQELNISNSGSVTTEALGVVAAGLASMLTLLDFSGNAEQSGSIDVIKQLTALKSLNFQGTRISAAGAVAAPAAAAGGEDGVANSDLAGGNVGVCRGLATLTALTHLAMGCHPSTYYEGYVVPPADLMHLSLLTNLKDVCIIGSKFAGSSASHGVYSGRAAQVAACFCTCTSLTKLTLRGSGLGSSNADILRDALRGGGMNVDGLKLVLNWQPMRGMCYPNRHEPAELPEQLYDDQFLDQLYGQGHDDGSEGDEWGGMDDDWPFALMWSLRHW